MLEPPKLIWRSREWRMGSSQFVPQGSTLVYTPSKSSWVIENDNPLPLTINSLRLTSRYNRWLWLGDPIERTWEVSATLLRPGQEMQVRSTRPPWFASLAVQTLTIIATYNNIRYKLGSYQRGNLFEVNQPLVIRLLERDWS